MARWTREEVRKQLTDGVARFGSAALQARGAVGLNQHRAQVELQKTMDELLSTVEAISDQFPSETPGINVEWPTFWDHIDEA